MCNWCSYAGADLAGVSRYQYPTNIRILRVMCSARVDPSIILEMFLQGADGVFVGGCHLGDCHYIMGNYYAQLRMKLASKILEKTGFGKDRLRLEWVSASEGERFSKLMKEFTEQISALGPSPIKGSDADPDIKQAMESARNVSKDFRLRTLVGKEYAITEQANVYSQKVSHEDMERLMDNAIESELARNRILTATKETPKSVKELSGEIKIPTDKVLEHIVVLRRKNLIGLARIDGNSPKFIALSGGK
jgi:coenzyme F420-reducing hydrogenase delta subunit